MGTITSRDNKTLKLIRSLKQKKGRGETGLYFAEGVRLTEEALAWAGAQVEFLLLSQPYAEENGAWVRAMEAEGRPVYIAGEKLFREACDTEAPQGIGAVLRMPEPLEPEWDSMRYVLVLDGVAEPGNLGTIIRTAEAAGVDCICLLRGCADPYNPKAVRAAMGSLFRMRVLSRLEPEMLGALRAHGYAVTAAALRNSVPIGEAGGCEKRALLIGSEAFGVSEAALHYADESVRIPMAGHVESLNAAVAAGIAMYLLKP